MKVSVKMQQALVGLSKNPGDRASSHCDRRCKRLVNTLSPHRTYCIVHDSTPRTIQALQKRGLIETVRLNNDEMAQQTLWEGMFEHPYYQLTEAGRRVAALARLGRKTKKR